MMSLKIFLYQPFDKFCQVLNPRKGLPFLDELASDNESEVIQQISLIALALRKLRDKFHIYQQGLSRPSLWWKTSFMIKLVTSKFAGFVHALPSDNAALPFFRNKTKHF